jgi:hypothetical protein
MWVKSVSCWQSKLGPSYEQASVAGNSGLFLSGQQHSTGVAPALLKIVVYDLPMPALRPDHGGKRIQGHQ